MISPSSPSYSLQNVLFASWKFVMQFCPPEVVVIEVLQVVIIVFVED
jgi:hypothetical protein